MFTYVYEFLVISVIDITKKPVVCEFGRIYTQFENVPKIEVDKYPCECEIMVFQDFYISNKSAIDSKSGMYVENN